MFKRTSGESVRSLRLSRGMTQRELAERTGLSQPALSAIEHNSEPLGLARAVRIAEVLGVHHRDIHERSTTLADTSAKPTQLTDEEWAVVEGRSSSKFLYGDDVRKLLYGERVPAHRWRRQA